jgi:hypothetical protein
MPAARLLALVVVASACGGARAPAGPPAGDPQLPPSVHGLLPGEAAAYVMTLGGIEIGEAAFAVGTPGEIGGRTAIVVASRASAAGLIRLVREIGADGETTIDVATGLPISVEGILHWGGRRFRGVLGYAGPIVEGGWYDGDELVESVYRHAGGGALHNLHSAMAAVRAWPGAPGDRRALSLHGAVNLWRVDLTWIGRETIGTAAGNQAAVRVDGDCVLSGNDEWRVGFTVWMSDDADRVPLRVEARFRLIVAVFELTEYRAPGSAAGVAVRGLP